MRSPEKNINPDMVNKGIPDNIEQFVTWLNSQGINYYSFEMSSAKYKLSKFKEFAKKYPNVLQYKLFY